MSASKSNQECNVDGLSSTLWLVKVPAFVAEQLITAKTDDIVGSLSISSVVVGGKATKKINVNMKVSDEHQPQEFSLEELSAAVDQQLISFSEGENMSYSLDGQITKKLILKPKDTQTYREVVRDRGIKAVTIQGTKQADTSAVVGGRSGLHVVDFIPPAHAEMKRKAAESGGGRASKGSKLVDVDMLKSKMFHAFSANSRQTLKDLVTQCKDVPGFTRDRELRDLLDNYAKYYSKGPFHGFWELKPEYRDHSAKEVPEEKH